MAKKKHAHTHSLRTLKNNESVRGNGKTKEREKDSKEKNEQKEAGESTG